MTTLWLDLETYSTVPIKHGTHAYAEAAEVLLVAWAYDDEPVAVWDMTDGTRTLGQVQMLIDSADRVVIHNSAFDRTVLRHVGVHVPVDKITDTMVLALEHSLPASLGALCDVLGVPTDKSKDKGGKRLIHLLTKPRAKNVKVRRATRETHPDEWQEFIEYARLDVDATRSVHGRLPDWNNSSGERHLWLLDQRINDRGVRCDLGLAEAALRAFQRTAGSLAARTSILTRGVVASLTQRQKLVDYLGTHHQFEVKDMTKATVASLLQGDLHPEVRELLEIRQQASATSPAKYGTILDAVSSDGRLRGTIQFCGASRTGRDSGRLFQPQNLPRPTMRPEHIEFGIEAMKLDCEDLLFDNVSELCASAVRGCLVAAPGHKLVVADLSNIEGRVLAWLAGEEWKVTAFYAYDRGDGHDLYKNTAGRILGKSPGDVTKAERQSQGKVPELACLGPHTRVITKTGVKLITEVTAKDLLWDGVSWVTNTGLVDRGLKPVVNLHGAEMTADHLVMVGETWRSAKTVASCPNFRDQALATGLESLRSSALTSDLAGDCALSWSSVLADPVLTGPTSTISGEGRQLDATVALKRRLGDGPRRGFDTRTSALTTITAAACVAASRLASIAATTPTIERTPTTAGAASTSMNRGEPTESHISRILPRLMGGIDLNSSLTELTTTGVTSRVISVSSENELTVTTCDMYEPCNSASTNLRRVYDIADAGPRNRFTILTDAGALVVHNCGYGGGVGAYRKMGGAKFDAMGDEEIGELVRAWRTQHPATVSMWHAVERTIRAVIEKPELGTVETHKLQFDMRDGWLRIRLPSKRYLSYSNARIEDGTILYDGNNQYTRKWEALETYYGRAVENIVQAVARDIFMGGMRRAEAAGYAVVLRVHDELVCEVPDEPQYTVEGLAACMTYGETWSTALPLAAAGHEMHRYAKLD